MILSATDLLERLMPLFADRTDDESLAMLEDITDTLNSFENVITEEVLNAKIEEVTEDWRKRYHDRFFEGKEEEKEEVKEDEKEEEKEEEEKEDITIDDITKGDEE